METEVTSIHSENNSYLISTSNIVTDIGDGFLELTGYSKGEIVNKGITEVFIKLLRLHQETFEQFDIRGNMECYLFTKCLEAREVTILFFQGHETNEKLYIFTEKPNSRLEEKFPYINQLCLDNVYGIAIFSAEEFILLKANQQYLSFLDDHNRKPENSIGHSEYEITPGFKNSEVEAQCKNIVITGKTSYVNEFMYAGLDRSITYWDTTIVPIIQDGKVKYLIHNATDATERVLNKKRLEELPKITAQMNEHLRIIIDNISDGLCVLDKNNNYTLLNQAGKDFFYQPDTIVKYGDSSEHTKYYDMQGHPLTVENMIIPRVFKGEILKNVRIIAKRPDKTAYYSMSGNPIFEKDGSISSIIMSCRDITEQIETEQLVYRQKEQLEAIIENMSDALFVADKNGCFIKLNKKARDYYPPNTLNKVNDGLEYFQFYDLKGNELHSEDIPINRVLRGETLQNVFYNLRLNQKDIFISVNGTPILNDKGELDIGIVCSSDVTEIIKNDKYKEQHQQLLLKTEKEKTNTLLKAIEMKDEFLSLISHEFKTPITVINSAIQAMEFICKDELSNKAKGYLKKIRQNSLRQLRLVNNILDITRISSGHFKVNKNNHDITFITKAIIKSIYLYTQQKGIYLTVSSKLGKKVIALDEEKYERILLNLLSNAIKYTPTGKRILVTISSRKGFVCIKVKDEGIGIPKDKQTIIFERFGQVDSSLSRQAEGSGIGLSLVKMLVESMGGSISVKSKEGIGSTFAVLLPNDKTTETFEEKNIEALADNRLIHATAIEFSDIYL